jgi:tRNA G46 methylase TrmB
MDVLERLQGIVDILIDSNHELEMYDNVGYVAVPPEILRDIVVKIGSDKTKVSLDLGCGNGGWTLLMAAAGFPSKTDE